MGKERGLISLGKLIWYKLFGFFVLVALFPWPHLSWESASLFAWSGLQLFSDPEEFTVRLEARRTESISNIGELSDCIQNLLWATSSELTIGLSLLSCLQMGKENLNFSFQLFTSKISKQPLIFGSFAPLGWGWKSKSYGKLKSH